MSKSTIYSEACKEISGFKEMSEEFIRKLVINGKSKSTHQNYVRQMAKLALYCGKSPLKIEIDELEEYLYYLRQRDTDALSSYKHLIYGLRKLYQLFGKEEFEVALPKLERSKKLPVVISQAEMKRLLLSFRQIRERAMFGLVYDAGLRISELTSLLIEDVNLERQMVHVRQSKNKKDRYVPISNHIVRGLKKHIVLNSPKVYMFENMNRSGMPISKTRVRALLKEGLERAEIRKDITVHALRHTYATHQLEGGQNIMVLSQLLGHSSVQMTLVYLHIAQVDSVKRVGCLEYLYPAKDERKQ